MGREKRDDMGLIDRFNAAWNDHDLEAALALSKRFGFEVVGPQLA